MATVLEIVVKIVKGTGRRYQITESDYTEKKLGKIPASLQAFYSEIKELRTGYCRFDPIDSFYEEKDRNKRKWLRIGTTGDADIYYNLMPTEKEAECGYEIAVLNNCSRSYKNKAKWHNMIELLESLSSNPPVRDNDYCLLDRDEWIKRMGEEEERRMRTEGLYIC